MSSEWRQIAESRREEVVVEARAPGANEVGRRALFGGVVGLVTGGCVGAFETWRVKPADGWIRGGSRLMARNACTLGAYASIFQAYRSIVHASLPDHKMLATAAGGLVATIACFVLHEW